MVSLQFLLFSSTAVILIAAVYFLRSKKKLKIGKFPPGYRGWPLIGEIISFNKTFYIGTLGNFMEQRISRFGRIFSSNLFGKRIVVSADAELNRFVLQNEMRLFEIYFPPHFVKLLGKSSLAVQLGESHKQSKSIITNYLSTATIQTTWLRHSNEAARKIFSSWENGSVHPVFPAASRYSYDIILKTVLGMNPEDPETGKLTEYFENVTASFAITIPINLPGTKFNKILKLKETMVKTIKQKVEERGNLEGNKMTERNDDFLEWIMKTTNLSIEQTGDLLKDLLVSGTISIARVIGLIIYFLQDCPKALQQLREEHLQVGSQKRQDGTVELTWENYKKMNFTQCVIKEALRFMPVMIMKKATADIKYKGYEIPHGSIFVVNLSGAHFDPSLFENPQVFNPWQWSSTSGIKKTKNLMAFGGGPRFCPGFEVGKLEIAVFLHHLILNYNWRLEKDDKPIGNRVVRFPNGLPIRVQALNQSL